MSPTLLKALTLRCPGHMVGADQMPAGGMPAAGGRGPCDGAQTQQCLPEPRPGRATGTKTSR